LFVLTAACALWMHLTVMRMLHRASPELSHSLEQNSSHRPTVTSGV
jgi:NNP family nitrate/nitrite transporter-like MFS transporter